MNNLPCMRCDPQKAQEARGGVFYCHLCIDTKINMKTCSKCSQEKCLWDFSFSIKLSKYYDVCKECSRKFRHITLNEKLRKRVMPFSDSMYAKGRPKKKGE